MDAPSLGTDGFCALGGLCVAKTNHSNNHLSHTCVGRAMSNVLCRPSLTNDVTGFADLHQRLNSACTRLEVASAKPCAQFQADLQVSTPQTTYCRLEPVLRNKLANMVRIYIDMLCSVRAKVVSRRPWMIVTANSVMLSCWVRSERHEDPHFLLSQHQFNSSSRIVVSCKHLAFLSSNEIRRLSGVWPLWSVLLTVDDSPSGRTSAGSNSLLGTCTTGGTGVSLDVRVAKNSSHPSLLEGQTMRLLCPHENMMKIPIGHCLATLGYCHNEPQEEQQGHFTFSSAHDLST